MKNVKWLGKHIYNNGKIKIKPNDSIDLEDNIADKMKKDFSNLITLTDKNKEEKEEEKVKEEDKEKEDKKEEKKLNFKF